MTKVADFHSKKADVTKNSRVMSHENILMFLGSSLGKV